MSASKIAEKHVKKQFEL
ncbi:Protein of unknown function [Bacillus wiedmannii]|nr:Protein of unknown function [Bacillus wiedmannii]